MMIVYFVHGLGANATTFWGTTESDLRSAPELYGIHIVFWEYPTSSLPFSWAFRPGHLKAKIISLIRRLTAGPSVDPLPDLQSVGSSLLTELRTRATEFDSIKIFGHSMGGIAIAAAIGQMGCSDDPRDRPLLEKLEGLAFCASPLGGASLVTSIHRILQHFHQKIPALRPIIGDLKRINTQVENLAPKSVDRAAIMERFLSTAFAPPSGAPRCPIHIFHALEDEVVSREDLMNAFSPAQLRVVRQDTLQGAHSSVVQNIGRGTANSSAIIRWITHGYKRDGDRLLHSLQQSEAEKAALQRQIDLAIESVRDAARRGHVHAQSAMRRFAATGELVGIAETLIEGSSSESRPRPAPDVQRQLAVLAIVRGDVSEAEKWATAVVSQLPTDTEGCMLLAVIQLQQKNTTDATVLLTRVVGTSVSPALRAAALNRMGWIAYREGRLDTAEAHFADALRLATTGGDRLALAYAHNGLASVLRNRTKSGEAEGHIRKVIELLAGSYDDIALTFAYRNLGNILHQKGDRPGAERHYRLALEIAEQHGDEMEVAQSQISLGRLLSDVGESSSALELLREALHIAERWERSEGRSEVSSYFEDSPRYVIAEAAVPLAVCLMRKALWGDAIQLLRRAIDIYDSLGYLEGKARARINLAAALVALGQNDEAEQLYLEAIYMDEKGHRAEGLVIAYGGLARILSLKRLTGEAVELVLKALEIAHETGIPGLIASAEIAAGLVYLDVGDRSKWVLHISKAQRIYASIGDSNWLARCEDLLKCDNPTEP